MQASLLIVVLALLSMVGALGIDTYLPSFPSIAASFGVSGVALYIGSAAPIGMGIWHQKETAFGWLFIAMIGMLAALAIWVLAPPV